MKVKATTPLLVVRSPEAEPEEQPTFQRITSGAPIQIGRGPFDPQARIVPMELPVNLDVELPAVELAQNLATQCAYCAHFRPDEWRRLRSAWERDGQSGTEQLDWVRGIFTDERPKHGRYCQLDEVGDVLDGLGVCEAITEITGDVMIVTPVGGCPEERGPKGEDLSKLFKPRDRGARKAASKAFDQIMLVAAGRS